MTEHTARYEPSIESQANSQANSQLNSQLPLFDNQDYEESLHEAAEENYKRAMLSAGQDGISYASLALFARATTQAPDCARYALDYAVALDDIGLHELSFIAALKAMLILKGKREPEDIYSTHRAGLVCSAILENDVRALGYFTRAFEAQKDNPDYRIDYCVSLSRCGHCNEAEVLAEEGARVFDASDAPLDADEALQLAHLAHLASALDAPVAMRRVQRALLADANSAELWRIAGSVALEMELFKDAAASYKKSAELNPNSPIPMGGWQHALMGMGLMEDAAKLGQEILERWPDDGDSLFNTATAYLNMGRYEDADSTFTDYLHTHPEDPDAVILLGLSYAHQGRASEARELQAKALQLGPNSPTVKEGSRRIDEILNNGGNKNEDMMKAALMMLLLARANRQKITMKS